MGEAGKGERWEENKSDEWDTQPPLQEVKRDGQFDTNFLAVALLSSL
jgi:hypothetical protein